MPQSTLHTSPVEVWWRWWLSGWKRWGEPQLLWGCYNMSVLQAQHANTRSHFIYRHGWNMILHWHAQPCTKQEKLKLFFGWSSPAVNFYVLKCHGSKGESCSSYTLLSPLSLLLRKLCSLTNESDKHHVRCLDNVLFFSGVKTPLCNSFGRNIRIEKSIILSRVISWTFTIN